MEQNKTIAPNELIARAGVLEIVIGPYEKFSIVQDERVHEFTGPARVLINQD